MMRVCVALCAVGLGLQGQPLLVNAKLETRAMRGSLAQEIAAIEGPAWLAYTVDALRRDWHSCWGDSRNNSKRVALEGFDKFHIFIRVEARHVSKIRQVSPDCEVDAGELPVTFLNNVTQGQSVAFLKAERNVDAIGPHSGPEADAALEDFITAAHPDKLRTKAAFWLGESRKQRGVDVILKQLRADPRERFRLELVFPLSRSREGIGVLLDMVRRKDVEPKLREKAMFWLARSDDPRATRFVEDILSR